MKYSVIDDISDPALKKSTFSSFCITLIEDYLELGKCAITKPGSICTYTSF